MLHFFPGKLTNKEVSPSVPNHQALMLQLEQPFPDRGGTEIADRDQLPDVNLLPLFDLAT